MIIIDLLGINSFMKRMLSVFTLIKLVLLRNVNANVRIGYNIYVNNRGTLLISKGCHIGNNVSLKIKKGATLIIEENVILSDNVSVTVREGGVIHIGKCCRVNSYSIMTGSVELADNVIVAPFVVLISDSHQIGVPGVSIDDADKKYGMIRGAIRIGARSFVGVRSIVLHNVKIGENAVIGANSLVLDDVEDNAVVHGSKAKHKMRS